MRSFLAASWSAVIVLMVSGSAAAQALGADADWSHGTTLNAFVGAGADGSKTGPLAGGSIGWEVTPRVAIEGTGYWLDRGTGADAFAAALKLQAGLTRSEKAVPFLQAGVGLYRAAFEPTAEPIPEFYSRRISADTGPGTTHTFTDPSFIFGGGLNVFLTRHVTIRPDVEVIVVRDDSQTYVVTAVAVRFAYHFEEHPVTPSQRAR
jgi:hypothetical protein